MPPTNSLTSPYCASNTPDDGKKKDEAKKKKKGKDGEDEDKEEAVPVEVSELARGPIESVLAFSANLEAESSVTVVAEAMRRSAEALEEEGMKAHWQIFVSHHVEGKPYEDICGGYGVDPRRAAVMARTASRRFRQALRDVVAWPGATETQVDAELQAIVEDVVR